jgi:hypothetical protein
MEKQRIKSEMEAKMMEQRAKYVAKAKKIALEPEMEEKPRKSGGGRVSTRKNISFHYHF